MGKRSAVVELFLGDMGSMQRELRPSTNKEDQLTRETKLEQIAVKAVNQLPKSVGAGNPHATFCGNRGRATASGDPVLGVKLPGQTRRTLAVRLRSLLPGFRARQRSGRFPAH